MMKRIDYANFSGGLHSVDNGMHCSMNELQMADNINIKEGAIRKRHCLYQDTTGTTRAFFLLDILDKLNFSGNDKKLYINGLQAHTYTTGGHGQFWVVSSTQYCHSNGSDAMVEVFVGTPNYSNPVMGAPVSRVLFNHNDRCFCINGKVLYETAVGTGPSSTVDNFAGGATWTIGQDDKSIIGLGSIGRNLLIFKENSIYIQAGYTKNERQTYLLTDSYGCLSVDSIKNVNVPGIGECVIFLSEGRKLCLATLTGVVDIGGKVQDVLDSVYYGVCAHEPAGTNVHKHRARGAVLANGNYVLSIADVVTDDYATWDTALYVNLNEQGLPITKWVTTSEADTCPVGFMTISDAGHTASSLIKESFICIPQLALDGTFNGTDFTTAQLVEDPSFDFDRYQDRLIDSGGFTHEYWIYFRFQTRDEDCGDKHIVKTFYELLAQVGCQNGPVGYFSGFPLTISQEIDSDLTTYEKYSPTWAWPAPIVYNEPFDDWLQGYASAIYPYTTLMNRFVYEGKHNLAGAGKQTSLIFKSYKTTAVRTSNGGNPTIKSIAILYTNGNIE